MGVNILDKRLRSIFVSVFLIVCMMSTTITFLLPETYASMARIKVTSGSPDQKTSGDFLHIIGSFDYMGSMADRLDLKNVWGKKYNGGSPLTQDEAAKLLMGRVRVIEVADSQLIAITVYSDDASEAAEMANVMAEGGPDFIISKHLMGDDPNLKVEVVEKAVPGSIPVRPNKPLDITLGIVFGLLAASGVTAIVGLFVAKGRVRVH